MKLISTIGAAAVFAALATSSVAGPTPPVPPVFDLSTPTPPDQEYSTPLDLGMDFTVNTSFTVTYLGAYTNGTSPIDVAIYDLTSTSSPVVSATITDAPNAGTNYSYVAVTPVTIGPGTYQIVAYGYTTGNGDYNPDAASTSATTDVTFSSFGGELSQGLPFYNIGGGLAVATTEDAILDNWNSTYGTGDAYGAGTFVPEPASWALMLVGTGLAGFALRSRRRERLAGA